MIDETISHYRIIDQLGEGGMGVVYLAEDTTLGRRVTMKFLSATTKELRARFLHEARAISALTHPNIATVLDYGETGEGQPYIVMELIKGESLSDKLREGSLPLAEAVRIVSSIAEVLSEVHHQGMVHCDLKPSNVVITERGQVKVLDFGLLSCTGSDVKGGTYRYMPPEQMIEGKVDARADLFALGVVLYECITGHQPFSIGWDYRLTPIVPSEINDRVPPELDRITMKAIEKKVEDRYQSADQLIEALHAVLPRLSDDRSGRVMQSVPKASSSTLEDLESEFDGLLASMQTARSKRAMQVAFEASPARLGRAAVKQASKKR